MQCRHNPAGRQLGLPTTTRGASVQVTAPHTAAAKCTRLSCAHPESLAALQMYIDTWSRQEGSGCGSVSGCGSG